MVSSLDSRRRPDGVARSISRLIALGAMLALLGLAVALMFAACTIERFFVLNETINYPTPKAT